MKKMKFLFLVAVSLMMFGLAGCGTTEIDLMDYVTVSFSGVNGQGTAVCNVDTVGLEQDLVGDKDGEISLDELEKLGWITQFESTLSYQLDQETGLSNGDQVTVSVTCDEDFAKENKVKVSEGKKEFQVEGLKEPVEVDAFAEDIFDTDSGVVLEYTGTAPEASLEIANQCAEEPASLITYTADKTEGIRNGDEITITAELSAEAAKEGYVLKESVKTVKVEGLNSYVESLSQINETDRAEFLGRLENTFLAEIENGFVEFQDSQGVCVDMNKNSSTFTNFSLAEDCYKVSEKEFTIVPFTVDTKGSYYWWGREYFENQTEKSFTGASGFIVAKYLKVDPEGNLVEPENVYCEVGGLFEEESEMQTAIKMNYGV